MFVVDLSEPTTYYGWPRVRELRNEWGAISVAVPGAVAGLCAAQESFGRLRRKQVLAPAIEASEAGLPITWDLVLAITARIEQIEASPAAAALLLPGRKPPTLPEDGAPPGSGADRIDLPALARLRKASCARWAPAVGFSAARISPNTGRESRLSRGHGIAACAIQRAAMPSATRS